jgi:hypothetical protein
VRLAPDLLEGIGVGVENRNLRVLLGGQLASDDPTDQTGAEDGYSQDVFSAPGILSVAGFR